MNKKKSYPLSNYNILNMLKNQKKFIGVYSRNNTPYLKNHQSLILNLDDTEGSGTHWTCICKNKKGDMIYYFDSYGFPPPQEIVDIYKKNKNKIKYSTNKIQLSNSIMCGYYCVMFVKEFYKNKDIYDILYLFDVVPTERNEKLIKKYFNVI